MTLGYRLQVLVNIQYSIAKDIMEVLKIEGISKRYGNTQAVDNLSLKINQSNIYGILGPNGSGKTTILAVILGVLKQDSGSFYWNNSKKNVKAENIGALLETPNFYSYLSLEKNLEIVAKIKQLENYSIDDVLETIGLLDRKYSKFYTLSLGMKQRLALASILLGEPEILVLDEPTNGLDPEGIADVRKMIIEEAKKGKTVILASHMLSEVQKTCTHVAILKKGKILQSGEISSLIKSKSIIIVSSDDNEKLYELMVRSGLYDKVDVVNNEIIIDLKEGSEAKDVNEFAFKHNIILTKFETQKKSLESEFLKMIK
ncbi:MAG: ABC transporter ATP-binding protein [Bacteroidetes bacterium]|nr:MAG: ABC transporter ATP-binding protein [Bacteroidota bacterium]